MKLFLYRTGKGHLNARKNFFPLRVTERWNRLPRGVVESSSLEILKTQPGRGPVQPALSDPALAGVLDQMIHSGSF